MFRKYRLLGGEIKPKRVKYLFGFFFFRRIRIDLTDMPIRYFLELSRIPFTEKNAHIIVGIYCDLNPAKVDLMNANTVLSVYYHVKRQFEKCDYLMKEANSILLPISDGVDRSHYEQVALESMIDKLAMSDPSKYMQAENIKFSIAYNFFRVRYAEIRTEQNAIQAQKRK